MNEVTGDLAVAMQRIRWLQRRCHDLSLAGGGDSAEAVQLTTEIRKLEPLRRQYIQERFFSL